MRFQLRAVALGAALLFSASTFAQMTPPPSGAGSASPVAGQLAPTPPVATQAAGSSSTVSGKVERWLVNPNGDTDGFLLSDGTQVSFPPHLSTTLLQLVKAGDAVEVTGLRSPNVPVLRATTSLPGAALWSKRHRGRGRMTWDRSTR